MYDTRTYHVVKNAFRKVMETIDQGPPEELRSIITDEKHRWTHANACAMITAVAQEFHSEYPERSVRDIMTDFGIAPHLVDRFMDNYDKFAEQVLLRAKNASAP